MLINILGLTTNPLLGEVLPIIFLGAFVFLASVIFINSTTDARCDLTLQPIKKSQYGFFSVIETHLISLEDEIVKTSAKFS